MIIVSFSQDGPEHLAPLVESATLRGLVPPSCVRHLELRLPEAIMREGKLSSAQLDLIRMTVAR